MKWQIAPEYRQEYWKKQARKGASSAPSSPASGKEVNPNFRGPNGQNLGYDTTMVSQFSAKDMSDRPVPPPPAKMHFNPGHPPLYSLPQQGGLPTSTPQRRRTDTLDTLDSPISPYHSHPGPGQPTPGRLPVYTLPSSAPRPHHSPTNPTLSSSYLDTPFPTSQAHQWPMNTPAPLRQNPRLAPPSTLVAPSKFMPDSSPGGPSSFWKQLGAFGTPGTVNRGIDISPLKTDMEPGLNVMSSSPPPMESHSPSKMASSQRMNGNSFSGNGRTPEAAQNGAHSGPASKVAQGSGAANGNHGISVLPSGPVSAPVTKEEDSDDEGPGGFDLARGFAPIGAPKTAAAQL